MSKAVVAVALILHGLVHGILALVPHPDAPEPEFATFFSNSWLTERAGVPPAAARRAAFILAAVAVIGFAGAGMALFDFLIPFEWWPVLAAGSAVDSLLLLIGFWNRYLIIGVLIDAAAAAAPFITNWTPE